MSFYFLWREKKTYTLFSFCFFLFSFVLIILVVFCFCPSLIIFLLLLFVFTRNSHSIYITVCCRMSFALFIKTVSFAFICDQCRICEWMCEHTHRIEKSWSEMSEQTKKKLLKYKIKHNRTELNRTAYVVFIYT